MKLGVTTTIDTKNISQVTNFLMKEEIILEKMSLKDIKFNIGFIKRFLTELQQQKVELQQEIGLYEKEELQEIEANIEKISNYLDRLYDFESFAE